MVGVAFYAHLLASGLGFYGLPRLLVPLAEEFSDGERAGVALLTAAMSLPGILVGPLVGRRPHPLPAAGGDAVRGGGAGGELSGGLPRQSDSTWEA
jgi:hypothetical protein